MLDIPVLDLTALAWFVACWLGYIGFARWKAKRAPSLLGAMSSIRREWIVQMLRRENRIMDAGIVANLLHGTTFFASTSMLVIGGLVALLGTQERAASVLSTLPFAGRTSQLVLELKVLALLGTFVYAFFEFTWSMRQFNFVSTLLGAAPPATEDPYQHADYIQQAGEIAWLAGDTYNQGLRAYYFALAQLSWFVNAWLFMGLTVCVVLILYWREFRSRTLLALAARCRLDTPGP